MKASLRTTWHGHRTVSKTSDMDKRAIKELNCLQNNYNTSYLHNIYSSVHERQSTIHHKCSWIKRSLQNCFFLFSFWRPWNCVYDLGTHLDLGHWVRKMYLIHKTKESTVLNLLFWDGNFLTPYGASNMAVEDPTDFFSLFGRMLCVNWKIHVEAHGHRSV